MLQSDNLIQKTERQRIAWADTAKGIAMILVVLGHCGQSIFFNGVYYYHLPVFIMISGFLLSSNVDANPKQAIIKRLKSIMWPYFTFGLAAMLFHFILSVFSANSFSFKDELLLIVFWENNANWFLPPLFFSSAIYILIHTRRKESLKTSIVICLISYLVLYLARAMFHIAWRISPVFITIMSYGIVRQNVFLIGRTAAFLIFLEFGTFICKYSSHWGALLSPVRRGFSLIVCGIIFTVSFVLASMNGLSDLHVLSWPHTSTYFLLSLTGSACLIFMTSQITHPLPLVNRIGQDTLVINGTHLAFNMVPFASMILGKLFPSLGNDTIYALLRTVIVLGIEYLLVIPLYKTILLPLVKYDLFVSRLSSIRQNLHSNHSVS